MDMPSDLTEGDMGMRTVLKRINIIHPPLDRPRPVGGFHPQAGKGSQK